jgi:hypothetical protein
MIISNSVGDYRAERELFSTQAFLFATRRAKKMTKKISPFSSRYLQQNGPNDPYGNRTKRKN